jgi:hypothetical protein
MTNYKYQISTKVQISNDLNDFVWNFSHSDLSGIWCLGLGAYVSRQSTLWPC